MGAGAGGLRRGSVAARDGFVIRIRLGSANRRGSMPPMVRLFMVPELAAGMRSGSAGARRAQEGVDDALRGFDIATGDGCRRAGVHDGALGRKDLDGAHKSGGSDGAGRKQAAEDVEHSRPGDGVDGVDAAGDLRICALKSTTARRRLGSLLTLTRMTIGPGMTPSSSRKSSARQSPAGSEASTFA